MFSKRLYIIILLLSVFTYHNLSAQEELQDTAVVEEKQNKFIQSLGLNEYMTGDETTKFKITNYIAPAAMIAYGFAVNTFDGLKKFDQDVHEDVQRTMSTNTNVDDGLLFVPLASVFVLDWCGVPARHSFKDRAIVTGSSCILGYGSALLSKQIIGRERPDGSEKNSFPSGHTVGAFVGAHILLKEYGHVSPWIPISGYLVASSVGFLRVTNNKHWFSDVIVGAGFGMLAVELSYLLLPILSKTFTFGEKTERKALTINPAFGNDWAGMGMSYTF